MDYNESAQRVDRSFDELFRRLDELEKSPMKELAPADTLKVVDAWRTYKAELARHMKEHKS